VFRAILVENNVLYLIADNAIANQNARQGYHTFHIFSHLKFFIKSKLLWHPEPPPGRQKPVEDLDLFPKRPDLPAPVLKK
jgi:hypothetical protein